MTNIINEYGGNPYQRLVDMSKLDQKDGVIKGILLHQGESNTGDNQWPSKVKKIYNDLINDLGLSPDSIPLLAGEVVNADQGGLCFSMNSIIAKLLQTLPNSYVISSSQCTDGSDNLHFDSAGYRKFGTRYAIKMLSLMGIEVTEPEEPQVPQGTVANYYEPECTVVGSSWNIISDVIASSGNYVMVKAVTQSLSAAASGSVGSIIIPVSVDAAGTYYVYARLNCPTADDDSYWLKIDNGTFSMCNGLVTSGWQWLNMNTYNLTAGNHTVTITYREDGAKLDKICIPNYTTSPTGKGDEAKNLFSPDSLTGVRNTGNIIEGYSLEQNYPNPFNPSTTISFKIPDVSSLNSTETHVTLKVFDILGKEIVTLVDGYKSHGEYKINFDASFLPSSTYFCRLQAGSFKETKKLILLK